MTISLTTSQTHFWTREQAYLDGIRAQRKKNEELRNTVNRLKEATSFWGRLTSAIEKYRERIESVQDIGNTLINTFSQISTHGLTIERAQRDSALFNRELAENTAKLRELQSELRQTSDETRITSLETRIDNLIRRNFELRRLLNEAVFNASIAGNERTRGILSGIGDLFGAGTEALESFFHTGGFVGRGGRNRDVPIIAQEGEAVFTPKQLENAEALFRRQGNVHVQVFDQRTPDAPPPIVTRDNNGNVQVFLRKVVTSVIRSGAVDDYFARTFGQRRRV